MPKTLYHYTSRDGAEGILQSRCVQPSTGKGDARFGHGVYLTSKAPGSHNMGQIAQNNYDGVARYHLLAGKTQVAFKFKIPFSEVEEVDTQRDVWLYTDGALSLDEYGTDVVYLGTKTGSYGKWYLQ